MKRKYVGKFFVLLLGLGLLVLSGCAGTQQTKDRAVQPGEDGRPAWYRISPPGT
jgi:hypothetical protein